MKHCICCGDLKPLNDYYVHKKMGDGHLNKCKECVKNYMHMKWSAKSTDPEYVKMERKRARDKYYRLGYRVKSKGKKHAPSKIFRSRYPEKFACHIISQRLPLQKGFQRHHWSYRIEHARDVIELSPRDHALLHRYIKYDQSVFMYRRCDTLELLDTKEKHIAYFWQVKANEERIAIAS